MTVSLPPDLASHLHAARDAYRDAAHEEALNHNLALLGAAELVGHRLGLILGHRFIGLCQYRLDRLEDSEQSFNRALQLAEDAGETDQALLIHNHLAATLVGLGRLDRAHELLVSALERAALPEHLHAHARLLGNMGALFDELGQRERADECYAKFEVLHELLGNPHRLANARGLAARSAELRGDFEVAERKYREEFELAERSGDPLRQIAAIMHRGRMAQHLQRFDEAEEHFRRAVTMARERPYERRLVLACISYAGFLRDRGDWVGAHTLLKAAESHYSRPEQRALVHHGLALLLRDARLFAESLWHMQRSVKARDEMYGPLKVAAVRKMAARRLQELREFVRELVHEAYRVVRDEEELEQLAQLVDQVEGPNAWRRYRQELEQHKGEPIHEHLKTLREQAESVWRRLLPDFDRVHEDTRDKLRQAELSYSSSVDDLGRSAHLLALVLERELKRRVFEDAQAGFAGAHLAKEAGLPKESLCHKEFVNHKGKTNGQPGRPWTLKDMLKVFAEVVSNETARPGDFLNELRDRLRPCLPAVRRLADLDRPIQCCDASVPRLRRAAQRDRSRRRHKGPAADPDRRDQANPRARADLQRRTHHLAGPADAMPRTRDALIPRWPERVPPLPAGTPADRPVSLLLRHGERPPLAAGEVGLALALTPAGLAQAEALGAALSGRLGRLHTSPILRCRETAQAVGVGAGTTGAWTEDTLLGAPGVFVADGDRAREHWQTRGHEVVLEHLAYGDAPWPGLAEPTAAAHRLAAHLAAPLRAAAAPAIHLFVTHDAILLPAVARLIAAALDRTWCPHFLEGAAFWREGDALCLAYRTLRGRVPLPVDAARA